VSILSTIGATDVRAKWPLYLLPWTLLGLALVAWTATAEKLFDRALATAERGEASPKIEKVINAFRDYLERRPVVRFVYGKPLPLPISYVRGAWESTWRPRVRSALVLGGAMFCLSCNLLLVIRRRGDLDDDDERARRTRIGVAVVLGGGATLLFVLLAIPLATRTVYIADDLFAYNVPIRKFIADSWAHGDIASWCPLLDCGLDLHGEGQAGLDHPWHQFLYRALPLDVAINLEMLGGYAFALAGMTLLLRRWGLGIGPSLFGAFTFAFGSNLRRYFHLNAVGVISHIPWLLLCIDVLAVAPDRRTAAVTRGAISLLTASQLLLGYPQWVWLSSLTEGIYLLICAASSGRPARLLADYVAGKTVGLVLGATQLLPTIDILSSSTRLKNDSAALLQISTEGSLHPLNFLLLICPYAFASSGYIPNAIPESVSSVYVWPKLVGGGLGSNIHEFSHYAGVTPVILAIALLAWPSYAFRVRTFGTRAWAFGGVLIVVGAVLALGRFSPLLPVLVKIPVISIFRCPSRYLTLMTFGLAILASFSLARLGRSGDGWRWPIRSAFLPAAVILAANLAVLALKTGLIRDPNGVLDSHLPRWPMVALNPILALTVLSLFVLTIRGSRWALLLLALVHVADLSFYDLTYLWRSEPTNPTIAELCSTDDIPSSWFQGRIWLTGEDDYYRSNPYTLRGLRVADAYLGMEIRKQLDYKTAAARRVAGVEWVLPKWIIAQARPLAGALPEVRLVPRARLSEDPRNDLAQIDLETTALVDVPVAIGEPLDVLPAEARVIERHNAEYRVKTSAQSAQLLVVSSRYNRGWKAEIDGTPATVVRANGDFTGCAVPAGEHEIHLAWESASHRVGRAVTAAGLVLLALSLALPAGLIPRRNRGRPDVKVGNEDDHVARA
jgi:hypothetical protein